MRTEPRWLGKSLVQALHDLLIVEHGGLPGLRDEGLLDSALARPRNLWVYGKPDLFALAARYATAIVRDHPFLDGNKRTAFAAACVFLEDNGARTGLAEIEVVERMVGLAAGDVSEEEFARWLAEGPSRRRRPRPKRS